MTHFELAFAESKKENLDPHSTVIQRKINRNYKAKSDNLKTQNVKTSFVTYLSYEQMIMSSSIQLLSGDSFCCFYSLSTDLRCLKGCLITAYFL